VVCRMRQNWVGLVAKEITVAFRLARVLCLLLMALVVTVLSAMPVGRSQVEVPLRDVEWPAVLSSLPATVTDLAVDEDGLVWLPVLKPPDESGGQVNALYRYDPANQSLETIALPNAEASAFIVRIEAGSGARAGKIVVAWESTLLEVDRVGGKVNQLNVPLDPGKVVAGAEPPTTRIYDIAVDRDGTVWVSRDHYPYLIAVYPDGSSKELPLPEGAGSPERLAVDGQGRIWATLIRHRPISNGPGLSSTNAYRFTLRFEPKTGQAVVLPVEAWNIAGQGSRVAAMAGDGPAPVQRLDTDDSNPVPLTEFGPTLPGDEMAAGSNGDVWFRSRSVPGLVRVAGSGGLTAFPLPVHTASLDSTLGGGGSKCVPNGRNDPACNPNERTDGTLNTPVLPIAVAPDGSAWFSTGDRIGHAVP
jgi:hypothetical protein